MTWLCIQELGYRYNRRWARLRRVDNVWEGVGPHRGQRWEDLSNIEAQRLYAELSHLVSNTIGD
jgi:hypothetical protein